MGISRQDSLDAKETVDRAYDQLLKGETFNLTTLDYSDLEGETLSSMTPRSGLGKETDSVLARLKPGQFSAPFQAPFGWQIVKLDSAKKDSVAYTRIIVRIKMGSEVLATVRDSVRNFVERAASEKFDTLAVGFGLTVQKPRPLVGDQKELPGLDVESPGGLIEWSKKAKPGQVYDLPLRGAQGYYVFELAEVKPAGFADYEKVKQAALFRLRHEKESQAWTEMAQQALAAIKSGKSLEQYAAENPGVELQTDSFSGITDCRRKQGPEFAGAVAALNPGEKYGVVEVSWGAFIIRCDARTSVATLDPAAYAEQRRSQVGQELMGELLKQPEVKDYRDALAY
jgi:parvulin-like peptidyl-prolyl isomerase